MAQRKDPPRYVPETIPLAAGDGERLQKILAAAGLGSRRDCEELILAGRVEVDRRVVSTLGAKANPHEQEIRIDGEPLPKPKLVHYMVNKPPGVVTTNSDPSGRPRVIDLVPDRAAHLFAVGRLDLSSEGLILVTNDGELANRLTHPRYGVEKTYHVEVAGQLESDQLKELRRGVHLAEGFAKVVGATIKKHLRKSTLLEVVLDEGKNREIRRLLARVGHKVLRLKRIAVGPVRLGELPTGAFRPLTYDEIDKLRSSTSSHHRPKPARGPKPAGKKRQLRSRKPSGSIPRQVTGAIIGADDYNQPAKKPNRTGKQRPRKPAGGQRK
jgi:23S rRNA pseudouridine2605 synthase